MPFFSIIIPTYNRAKFIKKAIQSALNQTFSDFEVIVIDDASTDDTAEIIVALNNPKIKFIKNLQNIERCRSRNKGIELAQGQYICFLDSDDYYLPQHLEIIYNEIQKREKPEALFFTNAWDSTDGINLIARICPTMLQYNSIFDYIATFTFNPQRMCIHRNIFKNVLFDPDVYVCEDLDLAARIALKYPIIQINERTVVYVFHENSFTGGDLLKPFKELENYNRIFQKPELLNSFSKRCIHRLQSMCYFHMSLYYEKNRQIWKMYKTIIKSFFLFPKGYNGKTNKILLVSILYNFPIFGDVTKKIVNKIKNGYKN